jgi:DNA-directed RNA polymerase III subunit RPC2
VDIKIYFRNSEVTETGLLLGRVPIMLGCCRCNLYGKSAEEVTRMKECPLDPKGYFVVKGVEKVLLIQEQLAENRIIVETNPKTNQIEATV